MEILSIAYEPNNLYINDGNGVSPVKIVVARYSSTGLVRFDFVHSVGNNEISRSFKIEDAGFLRETLEYCLKTIDHGKLHTQRFQFDFYEGDRKKRLFFRRDKSLDFIHIKFDKKPHITMDIAELKKFTAFVAFVENTFSKQSELPQQE